MSLIDIILENPRLITGKLQRYQMWYTSNGDLIIRKRKMINWNTIVKTVGRDTLVEFVDGRVSGRELTESVAYTKAAGEVRSLLRERGVDEARQLARKALSRR